jgi:myo-inositol-1(or 4)-monophosphatase
MLNFILELAQQGGKIAREHFSQVSIKDAAAKGSRDYVSHVDRLIEDAIISRIRAQYPGHVVIGEESYRGSLGNLGKEPCWIIDPIDGTTNFLHGIPAFAISIAFCDENVNPRHAIVYDPMRDERFVAERGAGLWLNERRVYSSGCADLSKALLATGLPFKNIAPLDDAMAVLTDLQRRCGDHRRAGSAALDLAYTAIGRLDGYWELGIWPWDVAAGELLVRCGGGVATDFHGQTGNLGRRRSIVAAATPTIHHELITRR